MLYHVMTGDLNVKTHATSHMHAASKAISGSDKNLGICVVVNEVEIDESDESGNVFFLTERILKNQRMRIVG
jgi:hypothetical protein